jgi:hypothetical protein
MLQQARLALDLDGEAARCALGGGAHERKPILRSVWRLTLLRLQMGQEMVAHS